MPNTAGLLCMLVLFVAAAKILAAKVDTLTWVTWFVLVDCSLTLLYSFVLSVCPLQALSVLKVIFRKLICLGQSTFLRYVCLYNLYMSDDVRISCLRRNKYSMYELNHNMVIKTNIIFYANFHHALVFDKIYQCQYTATTHSIMTYSIARLRITIQKVTLSIMILIAYAEYHYLECLLCWFSSLSLYC